MADTESSDRIDPITWQHHRVFATRGLVELHATHGFTDVTAHGAGYYPLPARVGRADPAHAAFITAVGARPAR